MTTPTAPQPVVTQPEPAIDVASDLWAERSIQHRLERVEQLRHQPTAQSLIQQLVTSSMAKDQKFYLVKFPEDALPSVEEFETIEPMVARIIELLGTETAVYPFMGYWLGITKGPLRYLVTPFGMLPLYQLPKPDEVEVDTTGWLGREPPVTVPLAPTHTDVVEQDEPEDDDVGEIASSAFPATSVSADDDGTPVILDAG